MLGEGARIALAVWREIEQADDLRGALASSRAGRTIAAIGLEADLDACAAVDATDIVPALVGSSAEADDLLEVAPWPAR
jgi:phosphosulfolactate phosphohydrolase-like enzyme